MRMSEVSIIHVGFLLFLSSIANAIEIKKNADGTYVVQRDTTAEFQPLTREQLLRDLQNPSLAPSYKKALQYTKTRTFIRWLKGTEGELFRESDLQAYHATIQSGGSEKQSGQSGLVSKEVSQSLSLAQNEEEFQPSEERNSQSLTLSLATLNAASADFSLASIKIDSIDALRTLVSQARIIPVRHKRSKQMIQALASYQFEESLALRELVANSLDSYYHPNADQSLPIKSRRVEVKTDSQKGNLLISDYGVGMGLREIVFFLLSPGRSSNDAILNPQNATDGVTGRFGQGFLSVLSFLKGPEDFVQVSSRTDSGRPCRIKLFRTKNGSIKIQLREGRKSSRGTVLEVQSQSLKNQVDQMAGKVIPEYFAFNERGFILLNGIPANLPGAIVPIEIPVVGQSSVQVYLPEASIRNGNGTVDFTVNGVLIQKIPVQGVNIYPKVVIDLSGDTRLTQDRGTIDYYDEKNKNQFQAVFQYAVENENYSLVNTIYPLLSHPYFSFKNVFVSRSSKGLVVPGVEGLKDLHSVGSSPAIFLREELVNRSLTDWLPFSVKTDRVRIIPSRYQGSVERAYTIEGGREKLVFLDSTVPLNHPASLHLLNILYKNQMSAAGSRGAFPLFSKADMNLLQPPVAPSSVDDISMEEIDRLFEAQKVVNPDIQRLGSALLDQLQIALEQDVRTFVLNVVYNFAERSFGKPSNSNNFLPRYNSYFFSALILISEDIPFASLHSKEDIPDRKKVADSLLKLGKSILRFDDPNAMQFYSIASMFYSVRKKSLPQETSSFEVFSKRYFEFYQKYRDSISIDGFPIAPQWDLIRQMEVLDSLIQNCESNGLQECAKTVFSNRMQLIQLSLRGKLDDPRKAFEFLSYLNRLGYVASDLDSNYDPDWVEFEEKNLVHLEDIETFSKVIPAVKNLYLRFCSHLANVTNQPQFRLNCETTLKELIQDLKLSPGKRDAELSELVRFSMIYQEHKNEIADQIEPVRKQSATEGKNEQFYSIIESFVPYEIIHLIYPIFFVGNTQFYSEGSSFLSEPVRTFESLRKVEEDLVVSEVIGKDANLIRKTFIGSISQHPDPYIWIKEVLKNAGEAGSSEFHLNSRTDQEGRLVVEIRDFGKGVSDSNMYYFYVPGLTSKSRSTDDINFGWGLFTVFKKFSEILIESSPDGKVKNRVYLKKDDQDQFYIARDSQVITGDSFPQGTKISMRQRGKASKADPAVIKGNLLRYAPAYSHLKMQYNGQPISASGEFGRGEVLAQREVQLDSGPVQIEISAQAKGGFYYNGLFHSSLVSKYLGKLPRSFQKILEKNGVSFAVNLNGKLKQNANRTGFIELGLLEPEIFSAFQEAALHSLARQLARTPEGLSSILPYDVYSEFGVGRDPLVRYRKILAQVGLNRGHDSQFETNKTDTELVATLVSLPLLSSDQTNISLVELKARINKILVGRGILQSDGAFVPNAQFDPSILTEEFQAEKGIELLLQYFSYQIQQRLSVSHSMSHVDDLQVNEDIFSIHNLPEAHQSQKENLKQFMTFLQRLARTVLKAEIEIRFFDSPNGVLANAFQGQKGSVREINFNIRSGHFARFQKTLQSGSWDMEDLAQILETLAHELTHTHESSGQVTHDAGFFERQRTFLNRALNLLSLSLDEINRLTFVK